MWGLVWTCVSPSPYLTNLLFSVAALTSYDHICLPVRSHNMWYKLVLCQHTCDTMLLWIPLHFLQYCPFLPLIGCLCGGCVGWHDYELKEWAKHWSVWWLALIVFVFFCGWLVYQTVTVLKQWVVSCSFRYRCLSLASRSFSCVLQTPGLSALCCTGTARDFF